MSPNYPENYGNSQTCEFDAGAGTAAIHVQAWNVEQNYDKLEINGVREDRRERVQGAVPVGTMRWRSDGSVVRSGWKLCPQAGGSAPGPAPGPSPGSSPGSSPGPAPAALCEEWCISMI